MALFSRGSDKEKLLAKLLEKQWRSLDERREWLAQLGEQGDLKAPAYFKLLLAGDSDLKRFAIAGFAAIADNRTLDFLLTRLTSEKQGVWGPLIEALHALQSPTLPSRIERLFKSKRESHHLVAVELLAADQEWRGRLDLVKLALRCEEAPVRKRTMRLLRTGLDDALVLLLVRDQLRSDDELLRHGAIEALAGSPDLEIVGELFDLLPDEPPRLQDAIIRGLARSVRRGGEFADRVMELLMPLMAAEDDRIRNGAAKLLAVIPDKIRVMRRFMRWAKGIAFWLRDRAFSTVANVAENLGEAILDLLRDEELDVVVGATAMAASGNDPCVLPGLAELVIGDKFDWWVKINALEAVAKYEGRQPGVILHQALDQEELQPAAIACLAARKDSAALPKILGFLQDPKRSLRLAALRALHHYKDPGIVPHAEHVARTDLDQDCRIGALELLESVGSSGVAAAASVRNAVQRSHVETVAQSDLSMVNPDLNVPSRSE